MEVSEFELQLAPSNPTHPDYLIEGCIANINWERQATPPRYQPELFKLLMEAVQDRKIYARQSWRIGAVPHALGNFLAADKNGQRWIWRICACICAYQAYLRVSGVSVPICACTCTYLAYLCVSGVSVRIWHICACICAYLHVSGVSARIWRICACTCTYLAYLRVSGVSVHIWRICAYLAYLRVSGVSARICVYLCIFVCIWRICACICAYLGYLCVSGVSGQFSNNYKRPARIHPIFIRNSFENHPKSIPKPSKIREKSTLCRGCIFGAALGAKREAAVFQRRTVFGAIFDQKSEKVAPR